LLNSDILSGMHSVVTSAGTAALIRQARLAAGLTQADLAGRIRTTQSVVSRWERGGDEPRLSTLDRILRACGRRLAITVEDDDVDRSQIRQQLAMTPTQRLASVTNLSRTLAGARRVT
jgi:transcriptional regulator with XRE-family HTH domain